MAGIVNKPLAIFRRPESPKPLHSRWGDTSISVPADGSWNQYDNPHRPIPSRHIYGPGFIPEPFPSGRTAKALSHDYGEDNRTPTQSTSVSRRNSLSLGALRPHRLSVRLASRPKHLRGETAMEKESHPSAKKAEFAYKPIHQDYPTEATEHAHTARYRYIPTNGRYLEDISNRNQPADSDRSAHPGCDSFPEPNECRSYRQLRNSTYTSRDSYHEDDCRGLRSSLGDSSGSSSSRWSSDGLSTRRQATLSMAVNRKRSLLKPVTLAMVPDPDEIYE